MINNLFNKKAIFILSFLFVGIFANAQEVIKEKEPVAKETTNKSKRQKIDGIIATLGDYNVLESDIDKAFLEISGAGGSIKDITRCQMLGKLLEDKLYAHQAIQDSIVVKDEEVKESMNQKIDYMVGELKSMENVVKYFKKADEDEFRTDMFEIIKQQRLASEMQKKIVDPIEITPEETRAFFRKIPEADKPMIGTELEMAQIVIKPKVSDVEKQKVLDKLKQIRQEVLDGASFKTRAVLYTDDKGSAASGGFYKINKKTPFVKEFKDVAYRLQEGEISEPFETEFGYHIILLEKIKGQDLELRHILMTPKITPESLKEAKEKIDLIKKKIDDKELTFAEAAKTLSDEKETRANGGTLVNPQTQDTHFELTKMDPELYSQVINLKNGEVSSPILNEDQKGTKSYKIVTVTNKIDQHVADYSKDYTKIRELALKEKQINAIAKWSDEKIKETYIKINGEYRDCDFANNWLKK